MTINLKKFQRLKSLVDEARRDADRAEGVVSTVKKELKEEFNCANLKAAKALLTELEEEQAKAEKKFNKELEEFEEEHGKDLT